MLRAFYVLAFLCSIQFLLGQGLPDARINLDTENSSLKDVLQEISQQSGVNFSYNPAVIDPEQVLSITLKAKKLETILDQLCKKIPATYTIIDGIVVLKAPPPKEKLITLSGFLSDASTGESLIGAAIGVKGTSMGTYTNEFGYYSLSLKPGTYQLICFHYGFKMKEFLLELKEGIQKNLGLSPLSYELPAVEIGPEVNEELSRKYLGNRELSLGQLQYQPEFAGEPGIVNTLQTLPGIKAQHDGSAYFFARGGERDQNIIYIDDAPIFNPSHLFGFYSIFIPDFAKSITVYKSDMPAKLGDRLSSITSIRTKDGNLKRAGFSGTVNPFVYRLSLETPIRKDKSSIFVTYRRSNFEWLYRAVNPDLELRFSDLQIKWNRKLNDKNRLYFTGIFSQDVLATADINSLNSTGITWANTATTLRWNHVFSPKLFSNTTLYTGSFANRLFLNPNYWKSELGMLSVKSDFTHYINPKLETKFGLEIQGYFTNPGALSLDSSIAILPNIQSNLSRKTVLYYQGKWDLTDNMRLNAGLRFLSWANLGPSIYYRFDENNQVSDTINPGVGVYNRYLGLDPRISLEYKINPSSQVKLSFGRYHQYLQMIANSISPFTTLEVWLPASPNIRPQLANQWALSYFNFLEGPKLELNLALYHKKMENQIDFEGNALTYLNPFLEGELRFGSTRSYGLEVLVGKDLGKWDGWVSYNYSRVLRRTNGLNEGREYPAFQDRPHDFATFLHYKSGKKIDWSFYWTSYNGSTFTSPTSFFNFNGQTVPVYGERNNDRLPSYHRLDIAFKYELKRPKKGRFRHNLTLSINNVLAHRNVFAIKFNKFPRPEGVPTVPANVSEVRELGSTQVYLVQFLPSITYRFKL